MSNPTLFFTYVTGIWHTMNNKIEKLTQIFTAMEIYEGHKSNFGEVMENSKYFFVTSQTFRPSSVREFTSEIP